MSTEEQKPVVEEPVVAPTEATPAAAEPIATESKPVEAAAATETAATTSEPAATTEAPIEAVKEQALKKDFAGEGTLAYKAPGGFIKKLAGFQKKFFWFGDEAVEPKHLNNYLRGEKPDVANHNAAWSSQTGKGLLYFSKHPSEKTSPTGIINLADVSDIKEEGVLDFFFHAHGQKHVFQATHLTERDTWVAALKTKVAEAKELVESITSSAGYKEHHSNLKKTAVTNGGVAGAVKAVETKKEEKKEEKAEAKADKKEEKIEAKTDKKEDKLEAKEAVKDRKSRSQSRKRNSIFGNFGLGKKEEHAEKTEAKEAAPVETATATEAPAVAPLDGPAVAAAVVAAPVAEPTATETAPAETAAPVAATEETRPAASKRSSIFGNFRLGSKKSEVAPAAPAKDTTVASTDAPVIPAPEAQEPLAASVVSPATAPTEVITNGTTPAETTKAEPEAEAETAAEPKPTGTRKSSLPFGFGKKEKTEGDEKPFFAKLRQTVKGKTSPKASEKTAEKSEEKAAEKTAEPEAEAAKETPAATEAAPAEPPIVAEPAVANHTTPQVSATA